MISQLFILSPRGDTIIKKEFRYDVPKVAPEVFFRTVKFWKDGEKAPAVFNEDGVNYLHIKVRERSYNFFTRFVWAPPSACMLHREKPRKTYAHNK